MNAKRGRNAAKQGRYSEDTIEAMMTCAGFPVCSYKEYDGSTPMSVRQYPTPHPYRPDSPRSGKNDFMVMTGKRKIYCQVKNQSSSGTTDEKLAFAFDIARFGVTEIGYDDFVLILLGTWWSERDGIVGYAKDKCKEMEMLAKSSGRKLTARVIVGPKEVSEWLRELPRKTTTPGLFNKRALTATIV